MAKTLNLPPRFQIARPYLFPVYLLAVYFVIISFDQLEISLTSLYESRGAMIEKLSEMLPPDLSRLGAVSNALLVTFQMALVGTILGVLISFPVAIFAARNLSPHAIFYHLARGFISLARTVPDLIWAIFFVITVGLGPFAGVLALMMDTIGFCGRFFAEAMEETDPGPAEALTAIGARPWDIIFCAVLPASMPSLVASSLFSLEKAVRSSVVLGLVGAGGIGVELKVSMDMFRYAEAATIILAIFVLVLLVEQVSSAIRKRIIES